MVKNNNTAYAVLLFYLTNCLVFKLYLCIMKNEKKNNWIGIDINLEISAFEYGRLYNTKTKELLYGVPIDNYSDENLFCLKSVRFDTKDANEIINENWFDKKSFFDFIGVEESEWMKRNVINKVDELISYYGFYNILGEGYRRKEYFTEDILKLINE